MTVAITRYMLLEDLCEKVDSVDSTTTVFEEKVPSRIVANLRNLIDRIVNIFVEESTSKKLEAVVDASADSVTRALKPFL